MSTTASGNDKTGQPWTIVGESKTWRFERVRLLGKGSYGSAFLVRDLDASDANSGTAGGSGPRVSPPRIYSASGQLLPPPPPPPPPQPFYVAKEICLGQIKKPSELDSIQKEITILKRICHPNVVRYVDCSSMDDAAAGQLLVILMEYCDGGDLHQRITRAAPFGGMPEGEIASILIQLLVALKHLHLDHRVLHRDLKPQNIFLTQDGIVKVGDFGVSTTLAQSSDFAKTFCGSPYYLAPELCEEKPYNGKADLWSVGVILYECMAKGVRPFAAKNLFALVSQIGKAQYSNEPLKEYPTELGEIVGQLLQRLPMNRPTFARLMRIPYLLDRLHLVPYSLLRSPEYRACLGEKAIQRALERKTAIESGHMNAALAAELACWAERDKHRLKDIERSRGLMETETDQMTEREKREMLRSGLLSNSATAVSPAGAHPPLAYGPKGPSNAAPPILGASSATVNLVTLASTADSSTSGTIPNKGLAATNANTMTKTSSGGGEGSDETDEAWNSRYDDDFEPPDSNPTQVQAKGKHSPHQPQPSRYDSGRGTKEEVENDDDFFSLEEQRENSNYEQWEVNPAVAGMADLSFKF
jgi:serine/threonine protein kinase